MEQVDGEIENGVIESDEIVLDNGDVIESGIDKETGEVVIKGGFNDLEDPADILAYLDKKIPAIDAKIVGLEASLKHEQERLDRQYGVKIRYLKKLRESLVLRSAPRVTDLIKSLLFKDKKSAKVGNITLGWRAQPKKLVIQDECVAWGALLGRGRADLTGSQTVYVFDTKGVVAFLNTLEEEEREKLEPCLRVEQAEDVFYVK